MFKLFHCLWKIHCLHIQIYEKKTKKQKQNVNLKLIWTACQLITGYFRTCDLWIVFIVRSILHFVAVISEKIFGARIFFKQIYLTDGSLKDAATLSLSGPGSNKGEFDTAKIKASPLDII